MQTLRFINPNAGADDSISVSAFGCGKAEPNFHIGPCIRNEYVLHYIVDGVCYYEVNNKKYKITAGDVFIIFPNEVIKYYTDEKKLMTGYWIDFLGKDVPNYLNKAGLTQNNLVTHNVKRSFEQSMLNCIEHASNEKHSQLYFESCLLRCLSCIEEANNSQNDLLSPKQKYIKTAIAYMEHYHQNKITVSDVSEFLNLERSYFYRIFKEEMEISPSEYLIQLRLSKAKELLTRGESIKTVSSAVGMDDIYYFSKMFSKKMNISPSLFKKQQELTNKA